MRAWRAASTSGGVSPIISWQRKNQRRYKRSSKENMASKAARWRAGGENQAWRQAAAIWQQRRDARSVSAAATRMVNHGARQTVAAK